MYERAGDNILSKSKLNFNSFPRECFKPPPAARIDESPAAPPPPVRAIEKDNLLVGVGGRKVLPKEGLSSSVRKVMTRRFSVSEKLRIIAQFKKTKNISSACRWVQAEFNRPTFSRKSFSVMMSNQGIEKSEK